MAEGKLVTIGNEIAVDPDALLKLYLDRKLPELNNAFFSIFDYLQQRSFLRLEPEAANFLNVFLENFFYLFTKADNVLDPATALRYIRLNALIANLTGISDFGSTDVFVRTLSRQAQNLPKVLALWSPRNSVEPARQQLFDINPGFASVWYSHFFDGYATALAAEKSCESLRRHLQFTDERLRWSEAVVRLYYGASYIDTELDRAVKARINQAMQARYQLNLAFGDEYRNNKIAVVTGCWQPTHAVFKNQRDFIAALRDDYELSFFPLADKQDTSLFQQTVSLFADGRLNIQPLMEGRFRMIYYPDVGMSEHSVHLANMRLAPIQVCAFGHSVSTYGALIDYYISGSGIENIDLLKENYSERPVLLPGAGIVHKAPAYEPVFPQMERPGVVINCPWSAQKCNYKMLRLLRRIVERSSTPLAFRFFAGGAVLRDNGYLAFRADVIRELRTRNVDIVHWRPYAEYLRLMEDGDFALDAYPYGGCNSVLDSLYLHKPIVVWRGQRWNNRVGPQMMETLGFGELVVENEEAYLNKALQLIQDAPYRQSLVERLGQVDIKSSPVCDAAEARHFKTAIDKLMSQHEELTAQGSSEAVWIEAAC